jgi:uncharacterized protein YgbK (DUF1537 family)
MGVPIAATVAQGHVTTLRDPLPPAWAGEPLADIRELARDRPCFALDDDPTGTQTVRDVPVLTAWPTERLAAALRQRAPVTYLLTNSRSLGPPAAEALGREIGRSISAAATAAGITPSVISRGDSTLRGHFPGEVDALADGLGMPGARILLAPFFGDGGRITLDGVHYLRVDGTLTPVAETEFARDPVFGFRSSRLVDWVAERTADHPRPVEHVDLTAIRRDGPKAVATVLMSLPPRGVLVVDSESEEDIDVVALGALQAELSGLPLIARTAASYVRARAWQLPAAPLDQTEVATGVPGLVVIGSHVPTTTRQLDVLLDDPPAPIERLDLDVAALVADPGSIDAVARGLASRIDVALGYGVTPVVATSRQLQRGAGALAELDLGALVSRALVDTVRAVRVQPRWILAKGGITSSDIATRGLGISEATVVGPLLPGVPCWRAGEGSRWPGMTVFVFPGNVGGPGALRDAVARQCGVPRTT